MKEAGIKVWVLTGDKVETAINIGFSSGLLDQEMKLFEMTLRNYEDNDLILDNLENHILGITDRSLIEISNSKTALILSGEALQYINSRQEGKDKLLGIADKVNVVLACRVTPKQKSDIVSMIRKKFPTKTTLSIGDGANDVNMITTAHVGVGIAGLEG